MKVAAIILAAGASRRLGQPKQEVMLGGETLLERTVRVAKQADLDPIYVIVYHGQPPVSLASTKTITNHDAAEGMASSIRAGVFAAVQDGLEGVVILACDQPAVTPEHLRELAADGSQIVASSYDGRNGVPAYFPASAFPILLKLRGDRGARDLLVGAPAYLLQNGEIDIDTPEDLVRAQALFP